MACVSCKRRSARLKGVSVFNERLAQRKTVNKPLANGKPDAVVEHSSPVSAPKITPQGWVVQCLLCGTKGSPAPLPELATSDNCNCKEESSNV